MSMKVLLCCCVKCENRYIREWVLHYRQLGFDNIVIYDNNDIGGERLEDVIGDQISDGFVILKNWKGRQKIQLKCYQDCYDTYRSLYDWIAYFDCDEFLELPRDKEIHTYLSLPIFEKFGMIHVNWMQYDDNDLVRYDPRPVQERFTRPMPYDKAFVYPFPNNNHVKSIVRCTSEIRWKHCTPHTPVIVDTDLICSNCEGNIVNAASPFCDYCFSRAYLKHYSYKTIEEFAGLKKRRGFPDVRKKHGQRRVRMQNFFMINEWTEEKQAIMNECLAEIEKESGTVMSTLFSRIKGISKIKRS